MVSYAVVGAPGVIRLFERCGYRHNPFSVHDLIVPQTKALPLGKVLKSKAKNWSAQLNIAESLVEVDFQAVETRLPLELDGFEEAWRPVLSSDTLRWFGKAPSNRFFQLGEGVVWLTQTHQDWEVLCSFTQKCTVAQRTCLAHELRKEATRRGIDVIRIPDVLGVEVEMRRAFEVLARRVTSREVSFVVKSVESIGRASPLGFLWAHF